MIHVPVITEIYVYKIIIAKEINFTACSQKYIHLIFYFQTNIHICQDVISRAVIVFTVWNFDISYHNLNSILNCNLLLPRCACTAWLAYPKD